MERALNVRLGTLEITAMRVNMLNNVVIHVCIEAPNTEENLVIAIKK